MHGTNIRDVACHDVNPCHTTSRDYCTNLYNLEHHNQVFEQDQKPPRGPLIAETSYNIARFTPPPPSPDGPRRITGSPGSYGPIDVETRRVCDPWDARTKLNLLRCSSHMHTGTGFLRVRYNVLAKGLQ